MHNQLGEDLIRAIYLLSSSWSFITPPSIITDNRFHQDVQCWLYWWWVVECNKPLPLMLTIESSPNLTVPLVMESSSKKTSRDLILWLVALVSKYYISVSLSSHFLLLDPVVQELWLEIAGLECFVAMVDQRMTMVCHWCDDDEPSRVWVPSHHFGECEPAPPALACCGTLLLACPSSPLGHHYLGCFLPFVMVIFVVYCQTLRLPPHDIAPSNKPTTLL